MQRAIPFVYIAGINGWTGVFAPVRTLLEAEGRWQVYGFDHWDDTNGPQWVSIEAMAEGVRALLDTAGVAQAVICGESFGGTVAQVFARRYPERTLALLPVATFAWLPFAAQRKLTEAIYAPILPLARRVPPGVVRLFRTTLNPALTPGDPAELRRRVAEAKMPGLATYLHRTRQALAFDSRLWLPTLRVPTLVVTGSRDRLIPPACSTEIARLIPGAHLHMIARSGHLAHIACAAEFVQTVETFWHDTHDSAAL